ncbi:hypothetical protein MMC20_001127 [Loxospora ochrophaea]|nr:hypothetical protein [Loxospora ochrophaea]
MASCQSLMSSEVSSSRESPISFKRFQTLRAKKGERDSTLSVTNPDPKRLSDISTLTFPSVEESLLKSNAPVTVSKLQESDQPEVKASSVLPQSSKPQGYYPVLDDFEEKPSLAGPYSRYPPFLKQRKELGRRFQSIDEPSAGSPAAQGYENPQTSSKKDFQGGKHFKIPRKPVPQPVHLQPSNIFGFVVRLNYEHPLAQLGGGYLPPLKAGNLLISPTAIKSSSHLNDISQGGVLRRASDFPRTGAAVSTRPPILLPRYIISPPEVPPKDPASLTERRAVMEHWQLIGAFIERWKSHDSAKPRIYGPPGRFSAFSFDCPQETSRLGVMARDNGQFHWHRWDPSHHVRYAVVESPDEANDANAVLPNDASLLPNGVSSPLVLPSDSLELCINAGNAARRSRKLLSSAQHCRQQ